MNGLLKTLIKWEREMDSAMLAKYRLLIARLIERASDHFKKLSPDANNFDLEGYLPCVKDRQELAKSVRECNGDLDGWDTENAYSEASYYSLLLFFTQGFINHTPPKKNNFEVIAIKYKKLIATLLLSNDPNSFDLEDHLPKPRERLELRQLIFENRSREFYGKNFKDWWYELYDDEEACILDSEDELKAFFASVLNAL
jgi:hypothetical protein